MCELASLNNNCKQHVEMALNLHKPPFTLERYLGMSKLDSMLTFTGLGKEWTTPTRKGHF
jgi:hypothetical protein